MTDSASQPLEKKDRVLSPLAEASERQGLSAMASNLTSLREWLSDDLVTLEHDLSESMKESRTLSQQAAEYLLQSRGKRIRPIVTLLSSRMGGKNPAEARHLAVACELVHAATLLHDDVLDLGTERRGQSTARVVYGNSASVLGGDHLLLEALRRVRKVEDIELLDRVIEVIESMVVAEALQLERRDRFEPDRQKYMDVAEGKTAVLFSWGMYSGGIVGGLSRENSQTLWDVGQYLGIAFQAIDDCLDLAEDSEATGKNLFSDIREGKLTLPLTIACKRQDALIAELETAAQMGGASQKMSKQDLNMLVDKIRQTGAVEEARKEARQWSDQALEALFSLPQSEARDALATVIKASVDRLA